MNVRFQKTARGEIAIMPRKEYEALVVKLPKPMRMPARRVWWRAHEARSPPALRCCRSM
jgi:hypothetical protein